MILVKNGLLRVERFQRDANRDFGWRESIRVCIEQDANLGNWLKSICRLQPDPNAAR